MALRCLRNGAIVFRSREIGTYFVYGAEVSGAAISKPWMDPPLASTINTFQAPDSLNDHQTLSSRDIPTARRMATKNFCLFPMLPLELREAIWECVPVRRRLWLTFRSTPTCTFHPSTGANIRRSTDPITLQINRESRRVALRFYQEKRGLIPGTSYINFDFDQVCTALDVWHNEEGPGIDPYMEMIPCDQALLRIQKDDLSKIHYLTVSMAFCEFCHSRSAIRFFNWYNDWASTFSSLKEVVIDATIHVYVEDTRQVHFDIFYAEMTRAWMSRRAPKGVLFFVREARDLDLDLDLA